MWDGTNVVLTNEERVIHLLKLPVKRAFNLCSESMQIFPANGFTQECKCSSMENKNLSIFTISRLS